MKILQVIHGYPMRYNARLIETYRGRAPCLGGAMRRPAEEP
jgi:hypothetical protein